MLARVLYAAVMLSLLGAFPRGVVHRVAVGQKHAAPSAESPAWAPRPPPERVCAADVDLDIGRAAEFAVPRIDR